MSHWAEEVLAEYAEEQKSQGVTVHGHYDPARRMLQITFAKGEKTDSGEVSVGALEDMNVRGTDSPIFVRRSSLNTQLMLLGVRLGF